MADQNLSLSGVVEDGDLLRRLDEAITEAAQRARRELRSMDIWTHVDRRSILVRPTGPPPSTEWSLVMTITPEDRPEVGTN